MSKSQLEIISDIKDHADLADAAYAFYEHVFENEKWNLLDKFYNYKIKKKPNARWDYADGITKGHEIEEISEELKNRGRQIGDPTAYAIVTESRFSQERIKDKR
ncbi:MAG: hypothetical protein K5978_04005 [Campylobacter sp.]|nr:hypothetical protein [Campylobacter sp.]